MGLIYRTGKIYGMHINLQMHTRDMHIIYVTSGGGGVNKMSVAALNLWVS